MGGGASPLNTGGGMGGQQGQQQPYTPQMSMGMPQTYQTNTGGFPPGMFPSAPQQQQPQQQMQGLQPTQLGTKPEMPQYHPQMPPGMQPAGINPYQQQMQAQQMLDMQRAQQVPQQKALFGGSLGQQFGMQQQQRNPTIPLPGQSGYDPRFTGTLGAPNPMQEQYQQQQAQQLMREKGLLGGQQQPMDLQRLQQKLGMQQQFGMPPPPGMQQQFGMQQQQQPQPMGQQAAQRQSDMLQGIESLLQSGQTPTASNRPRRTSRLFGGR
jgi:hypothetical protein